MADENKPLDPNAQNDSEAGETTPARDADNTGTDPNISLAEAQTKTVRELRDTPVDIINDAELPAEVKDAVAAESDAGKESRRETEAVLNKPIEAIEDAVNRLDMETAPDAVQPAVAYAIKHNADSPTTFFGVTINAPIYTVIFGILAVITIIEVLLSEFPDGFLQTILLAVLSVAKAVLVVAFYMHLREDSRFFLIALLLPVFIGFVALIFLLSVSPTEYPY